MRAVVQRVKNAEVQAVVNGQVIGRINQGLVVLLGVEKADDPSDVDYLAAKLINLRVFEDEAGKMNHSLLDIGGQALIVSQFTLYGDCSKGRRPDFTRAASPQKAEVLYLGFVEKVKAAGIKVATGVFGAMMLVKLDNYGPVTLILDSKGNCPCGGNYEEKDAQAKSVLLVLPPYGSACP